jgi:hypothetical protein
MFQLMKEGLANGWFPESQKAESKCEQQPNFGRRPEVGIRLASEWIHLARGILT